MNQGNTFSKLSPKTEIYSETFKLEKKDENEKKII